MAEIKFYQNAEKTIQIYPEINPEGNYPGIQVGLADNLSSSDGTLDTDTWQYRSSGGELDIADGYAEIRKLIGTTKSTTIEENLTLNIIASGVTSASAVTSTFRTAVSSTSGTYNFIYSPTITYSSNLIDSINTNTFATTVNMTTGTYTFTYNANVATEDNDNIISSFNQSTFLSKIEETQGTYIFSYDGTNWNLNGNNVTLSQYGIVTTGSETNGDSFTIFYSSNYWSISGATVTMSNYGIITTGEEEIGDTIVITYTSNDWKLNNSTVNLVTYGISIDSGTPVLSDTIQIIYIKEQIGTVTTSNPTELYSIGLNQFNVDGNQILSGYTIDSTGAIVAASGSYVIYFKCLDEVYTIYNQIANSITRAGYSETVPITLSTVTVLDLVSSSEWADTLINNDYLKHYQPSDIGYLCVATTNIDNLCCHLTWEGTNEEVYETYFEDTLSIPYIDENGTVITNYGLVNLGSTYYDEIDFKNYKFYKRTSRIAYSSANLATIKSYDVPYLYDNNYIYYGVSTVTYNLVDISNAYKVSNYGTEEFVDSDIDLIPTIFYQDNLKDKLRFSTEVIDNKVTSVNGDSTDIQYPSAKCVYNMDMALRHILGLDVETFSTTSTYIVGSYVIHNLKLWKCTTAVTSAGPWDSTKWTESYLFTN